MARDNKIIRTADICDNHRDDARICELPFRDVGGRTHFHGEVVCVSTYEDNSGLRAVLAEGGAGRVLVVDGRGSFRRALCGGNIAKEAFEFGWEGLVFNGAIRDSHEFEVLDFGVKTLGLTAMPPRHTTPMVRETQLRFGGTVFNTGDYLYADQDCVIVLDQPDHE
ncbi:MAG: ribonuclease E activity regulator RraA [Rhodospirillales bacterium]|nr:ribonuclease E activity regulator RraA [Rhodospirillales bacterium]